MTVAERRQRQPLTFGGLLDETVQLYRTAWMSFVGMSAIALIPGAVLTLGVPFVAPFTVSPNASPEQIQATLIGIGIAAAILVPVGGLIFLLWTGAVTLLAQQVSRGESPSIAWAYRTALGSLLVLLGSYLVLVLAVIGLTVVASILLVLTLFGTLGSAVAIIGLIVWWLKPDARKPWLKWLIILTAPFGLVAYYSVRWALFTPAIVLEKIGPLDGLRRSSALVSGYWFRSAGFLFVLGIIYFMLQAIPNGIISALLIVVGVAVQDDTTSTIFVTIASGAAGLIGQVLFGALSPIGAAVLFNDLKNRREGADLAERVSALDAPTL